MKPWCPGLLPSAIYPFPAGSLAPLGVRVVPTLTLTL